MRGIEKYSESSSVCGSVRPRKRSAFCKKMFGNLEIVKGRHPSWMLVKFVREGELHISNMVLFIGCF